MKKFLLVLVIILSFKTLIAISDYEQLMELFDSHLEVAQCLYDLKYYDRALDALSKINYDYYVKHRLDVDFLKAKCLVKLRKYGEAGDIYFNLAKDEEDPVKAIKFYQKALDYFVKSGEAKKIRIVLAQINVLKKQIELEANRKVVKKEKLVKVNEVDKKVKKQNDSLKNKIVRKVERDKNYDLGLLYYKQGNNTKALEYLSKVKGALEPKAKYIMALIYQSQDMYDKAYKILKDLYEQENLEKELEKNVLITLISLSLQRGEGLSYWLKKAYKYKGTELDSLLELYPSPVKAERLLQQGKKKEAAKIYKQLMELDASRDLIEKYKKCIEN